MKPRPNSFKTILRKHAHELILATALTLVGLGALAFAAFGAG